VFDRKEMDRVTEEVLEENGIAPSRRGSAEMLQAWKKKAAPSRGRGMGPAEKIWAAGDGFGRDFLSYLIGEDRVGVRPFGRRGAGR
jgi:hypothetical protein